MTQVHAHRGLSAEHPENTLAAFEAALAAGFAWVELDIRLTHDNEVVTLHDASIARTTDGAGRVADFDYDELRSYDTGAGPIPRFDDVLKAMPQAYWNVEIKARDATKPALEMLEHRGALDRCIITSMDPDALATAASAGVPMGLITLGPPDADDIEMAKEMGCTWLMGDEDFLSDQTIGAIRAEQLRVGAWTVNDAERAHELIKAGAEVIITDTREVLNALG